MQKDVFRKSMVLVIIVLFFGAGVIPSISGNEIVNDQLDQQQSIWNGAGTGQNDYSLAQSFLPTLTVLTRVELITWIEGGPSGDLVVSIRSSLNGPDLTSTSIPAQSIPPKQHIENPIWLAFDFPDIVVVPEQMYYIIWSPDSSWDDNNLGLWGSASSNPYYRGNGWYEIYNDWVEEPDEDYCFKTYGYNGSDQLDQQQSNWDFQQCCYGSTYAQSFKPTFDKLTRIEVGLRNFYNPEGEVLFSIRDSLNSSDLTSVSILADSISTSGGWYEFDFPDIDTIPQESYYLVFTPDELWVDYHVIGWGYGENNPYPNGEAWMFDHGWQIHPIGVDYCFKTYGYNSGGNQPPNNPNINGPIKGKTGIEHEYTFVSTDPDGHDISYCIDWGDDTEEICIGPFTSGEEQTRSHTWNEDGNYVIRIKAQDIHGAESDYATLPISIPKNKATNTPFLDFLENHPRMFPLLRQLFGLQ